MIHPLPMIHPPNPSPLMLRTLASLTLSLNLLAAPPQTLFESDFQQSPLNEVPPGFLVLDGAFTIQTEGDQRFLELPGAPLETFGLLTLPKENFKDNIAIHARLFGTAKGRRAPTFAVGLGGVGGYRLVVSPGKKQLELVRSDAVKASAAFEWKSGAWTHLRLQVRKLTTTTWRLEGKAWTDGQQEPADWTLTCDDSTELPAGRPSLWGSPFSGTPIRFDDVRVTTVE